MFQVKKMYFPKSIIIIAFLGIVVGEKNDDVDISSAFVEVANSFFSDESPGPNRFMNENNNVRTKKKIFYLSQIQNYNF